MKKILILLLNVVFLVGLNAQITNEQQVISNAGNYSEAGGISLSWTLGETVIATFDNGGLVLTQGFQQPMFLFQGQIVVVPAGWSGVSSYVIPNNPAVVDIFADVVDDLVILQNGYGGVYWPDEGINGIGDWVTHDGYKIKTNAEMVLFFEGMSDPDQVVVLNAGWTVIPVLSPNNVATAALFGPLGSDLIICKEIAGNRIYWPDQGIFNLNFLEPGKAYQIAMSAPGSLDFSGFDALPGPWVSNIELNQLDNATPWNDVVFTGTSHTIAIDSKALENIPGINYGDYIGVFTQNNICAGLIQYNGSMENVSLAAFSDDATTASMTEGFIPEEYMSFKMYRPATGEEYTLEAEFDVNMPNTDIFAFDGLSKIVDITVTVTSVDDMFALNDVEIYPNPANDRVTINCIGNISNNAEVFIYSIEEGKLVKYEKLNNNTVELDISQLAQGVYFVKVTDGANVVVKKLIKHSNAY